MTNGEFFVDKASYTCNLKDRLVTAIL